MKIHFEKGTRQWRNDKIFLEILSELRRFIKIDEERINLDNGVREAIIQMRDYLKEHQAIID